MAVKKKYNVIGGWAFLIGIVLAVLLGIAGWMTPTWISVLAVIGIIIGLVNVVGKECGPFLISGAVLIIASALGQSVTQNVQVLNSVLSALLAIFVPATIVVAIKNVFSLSRD